MDLCEICENRKSLGNFYNYCVKILINPCKYSNYVYIVPIV